MIAGCDAVACCLLPVAVAALPVHEKVRAHARIYCEGVAFGQMGHLNTHIDTVHLKLRDHAHPYCEGVASGRRAA